ncbi:MAG: hypothetical protein OHK93_001303 [Ramalina farinacea]|uniref:Uncharacterized protein n=1 Tax=Ramalina farinacea TaxID=258253 RepID=A0AA43QSJ8_9LECA|nr:hypothetical protein [Ramalina farinacea]
MVLQRGSEAASAKRPSEGDSSVQDALDRVAKRLKVKRQTLLKELQAEFRLPASNTFSTALPLDYGSQIYDWLDAHDDEDESDSEDYNDAVEAQIEGSSVKHLPTPPDAQTRPASRDKKLPSASLEPARPVSQEEERKALLGIFRASSSGATSTNPGKEKGGRSFGSFYYGSNADVDSPPPAASKRILDTSDIESVDGFLEQEEGGTELAFEPKNVTHSPEFVSNQPRATASRPTGPELKRKAIGNDSRRKETGSSAPFVTASKRESHADDNRGTAITTTQNFVTKSKRRNLVDDDEDDEGTREVQGVETEAVKLFEGFFGYSPTSDPWKAHSLAKGPGDLDKSVYRHQTMTRRVAAVMVGAPTKWVSFTVLPSARRPAAPVRFRNAPSCHLVKPTTKNQTQAYQIYPLNRSIQVISEGLDNRRSDEFKQKQSEKARQVWAKRKLALTFDPKVSEEPRNIERGSLPPPLHLPQHHVSPRWPHQTQSPNDDERGRTQAAVRPGQPPQHIEPRSKGYAAPETGSLQDKRDPMTGQSMRVPYTPRSVLGASPKSVADRERAEAYYQTHREKLREARARQHKHALDRSRVEL